jgi:hypothetical protein
VSPDVIVVEKSIEEIINIHDAPPRSGRRLFSTAKILQRARNSRPTRLPCGIQRAHSDGSAAALIFKKSGAGRFISCHRPSPSRARSTRRDAFATPPTSMP